MPDPTFCILDDGVHFEWSHDCTVPNLDGEPRQVATLPHGRNGWQIIQQEPLTVTPSILCGICGTHGFIRDGQWVPA